MSAIYDDHIRSPDSISSGGDEVKIVRWDDLG